MVEVYHVALLAFNLGQHVLHEVVIWIHLNFQVLDVVLHDRSDRDGHRLDTLIQVFHNFLAESGLAIRHFYVAHRL